MDSVVCWSNFMTRCQRHNCVRVYWGNSLFSSSNLSDFNFSHINPLPIGYSSPYKSGSDRRLINMFIKRSYGG